MTPRELHTAVAALWPDSTGNEFMLDHQRVIEETAVSGDYDGFVEYVMKNLYHAATRPHPGCECWSCRKVRVLRRFISYRNSTHTNKRTGPEVKTLFSSHLSRF